MSEQFISVITNEAMSRVCYAGGWNLKPIKFYISQTDILDGWEKKDAWDSGDEDTRNRLKEEAFTYLKNIVTETMQNDYTSGNVWYNANFASVSKANETTLTHHVVIPGDVAIDTSSKTIKTIYFLYQDNAGQNFLYAIARSNTELIFETGITQSFFFNFTVTNSDAQEMTEFILNYSSAQEIEDHNTTFGPEIHSNLVARDGSRTLNGVLSYTGIDDEDFTKEDQLVSKGYVDKFVKSVAETIKVIQVWNKIKKDFEKSDLAIINMEDYSDAQRAGKLKGLNLIIEGTKPLYYGTLGEHVTTQGTSGTFTNGGCIISTDPADITVQPTGYVFKSFTGLLPMSPGTSFTSTVSVKYDAY